MSEFDVSIHALLAECDFSGMECAPPVTGFNPRTPCGVRHAEAAYEVTGWLFQSTHSLRSATILIFSLAICQKVSIHALLAECDCAQPYTLLLNKANHTLRQPP